MMQVSASIRYTLPEQWLLVKGVSTRFTQPSIQFPDLATRLVYGGHLRAYFRGAKHCEGCASIKAAADGAPRFGSAEAWRRLGTMHHISTVVEQLRVLPAT
jgi:Beta protein